MLLAALLASGCSTNSSQEASKAKALVQKACFDSENGTSWQERANLIAQANALDEVWERLAAAVNNQAGAEAIAARTLKSAMRYEESGKEILSVDLSTATMYAQFIAECSRAK